MIFEISQIKKFLADKYELPLEGDGLNARVIGQVPDGEHVIPIGTSLKPTLVNIKDGKIWIMEQKANHDSNANNPVEA